MSRPRLDRTHLLATIGLAVLFAGGWSLCVPGCFSIDEATLLLSARSMAQGHGVEVWNGFEETGSLALAPGWLKLIDGRLVSQYPDFFPLLALPAFRALGMRGLTLVNLLAFFGILTLTWRLAAARCARGTAVTAVALLVLGSFAVEYAVGAWPHMTSALFVLAPLALLDRVLDAAADRRALVGAAAAGLIGGFGVGVRLDVVLGLGALAAALLVGQPRCWRLVAAFAAGTAPGLLSLATMNLSKFGRFSPFDYGPGYYGPGVGWLEDASQYWALVAFGLAAAIALLAAAGIRRRHLGAASALLVAVSLLVPGGRSAVGSAASGLAQLTVDLRLRGAQHPDAEPGRERGDAVRHFGELKKSLLQSCPWVAVAAVWAVSAVRRREERARLLLWVSVPAVYVVTYGVFAWDGGLALNQRYFVAALPLLALLAARGLAELRARAGWPGPLVAGIALLSAAALLATAPAIAGDAVLEERFLLDLPLGLAGLAALVVALSARRSARIGSVRLALATTAIAVGAAVFSCLFWDLPRTLDRRTRFAAVGDRVRAELHGEALLLSEPTVALASAIDASSRARLGNPAHDFYRSFGRLVDFHLAAGQQVIVSVPDERYAALVESGLERLYRVRVIGDAGVPLYELLSIERPGREPFP